MHIHVHETKNGRLTYTNYTTNCKQNRNVRAIKGRKVVGREDLEAFI